MERTDFIGKVNSIQTLGTLDGPGVRFVVFMQGWNLRCGCCHNPETWETAGGTEYSVTELADKTERYREYFKDNGGITLTGGEPLLQAEFVTELFNECHKRGINTCLDTSGSILNDSVKEALSHTDRVLLDIKYTTDEDYKRYVGCSIDKPLRFLDYLDKQKIPTTVRQVIIPTLNDSKENILKLKSMVSKHACIDKIELLPFKKLCQTKYDNLNLEFKFSHLPTPTKADIEKLKAFL
ncbi:MAG: pyruvate formate lyase-activating protein [Clostridia bacterium]|nr:pyruvate formate lyase-activating protein [Clostridia bacterium]